MNTYNAMLRENYRLILDTKNGGISFVEDPDFTFQSAHNNCSLLMSTCNVIYSHPGLTQTCPIYSPVNYQNLNQNPRYIKNASESLRPRQMTPQTFFKKEDVQLQLESPTEEESFEETNIFINDDPNIDETKKEIQIQSPLYHSDFKLVHKDCTKRFSKRILCYFAKSGSVKMDCDICDDVSELQTFVGSGATLNCNHYVACNECRCRIVRRLLRCSNCCIDLAGTFPICEKGNCVQSPKHFSLSATCPRCERKLRNETCSSRCNRRKVPEYSKIRIQLNGMVCVLVQHPAVCKTLCTSDKIIRPCAHYSLCEHHDIIYKGHGKESACPQCKDSKIKPTKRQLEDFYPPNPTKKQCISHI